MSCFLPHSRDLSGADMEKESSRTAQCTMGDKAKNLKIQRMVEFCWNYFYNSTITKIYFFMYRGIIMRKQSKGFSAWFGVLAAILTAAVLSLGSIPAALGQEFAESTGITIIAQAKETQDYQATANLNVRSTPSKKGKILGKLAKGDTVAVSSVDGSWAEITYNGSTAYVSAQYLTAAGSAAAAKAAVSTASGNSSDAGGQMVWLSATGEKYHSINHCGRMNPNKARQVTLQEALDEGYEACSKCW